MPLFSFMSVTISRPHLLLKLWWWEEGLRIAKLDTWACQKAHKAQILQSSHALSKVSCNSFLYFLFMLQIYLFPPLRIKCSNCWRKLFHSEGKKRISDEQKNSKSKSISCSSSLWPSSETCPVSYNTNHDPTLMDNDLTLPWAAAENKWKSRSTQPAFSKVQLLPP